MPHKCMPRIITVKNKAIAPDITNKVNLLLNRQCVDVHQHWG